MRKFAVALACLWLLLFSSNASAFFFFFLPGSVTGKIADAFTGAEGENCVGPNAKVGDPINLNGVLMTIKSLSGTSSRCTNAAMPIRASLVPSTGALPETTSEAKIDLPDGWEPATLTDAMKANGTVLFAKNRTIDAGLLLSATKRSGITDMSTYVNTKRTVQGGNLQEPSPSEISRALINGVPAWRFSVSGKLKTGLQLTYLQTIYESEKEVVAMNMWTTQGNFEKHRDYLVKIADSLTGLPPPFDPVKDAEEKRKAKNEETKKLAADLEAIRILDEETKRLGAEVEAKRIAEEEQAKRISAEADAIRVRAMATKNTASGSIPVKSIVASGPQIDFNVEAIKTSRILGCQPSEVKVVGAEKENILYAVVCSDSKALRLSCDPSGLCLQRKNVK